MGYVVITLDTTAPGIVLGSPSGTRPGETLQIPFELSEPASVSAILQGASGDFSMSVIDHIAEYVLPRGFEQGIYRFILTAIDDVGNESSATLSPLQIGLPMGYFDEKGWVERSLIGAVSGGSSGGLAKPTTGNLEGW